MNSDIYGRVVKDMAQAREKKGMGERLLPVADRKAWVDGLRAIALLFVIFGHQVPGLTPYFVFTSPIKIPLFFVISGYVFNDARRSVPGFFRNLLVRLIVPWLCLTVPFALVRVPSRGLSVIPRTLLDLISGEEEWYMPCCVVAEVIWFFTRRCFRCELHTCLAALAVFALGVAASVMGILDYGMVNRAMLMQLFMLVGYLFRAHEDRIAGLRWPLAAGLCAAYVALGCVSLAVWPGRSLDVHMNRYYNFPFCLAMMLLGCFAAMLCARKLERAPRPLRFIGQNTLVYYLLHRATIAAAVAALSAVGISVTKSPVGAVVRLLIACVGCWAEAMLLNRFLPEAVGRKRRPGGR